MARLTRDDIIEGWIRLGELAVADGQSIELVVVGGAVMAVYFRSRDATADVDAIFEPARETRAWAARVAEEKHWPEDWLNDGAKGYVTQDSHGPTIHQSNGISVRTVSIPHLLAMKLMAWRDDVDFSDAARLLTELRRDPSVDVSNPEKLLELVDPFFIEVHRLKAKYAVEELWELTHDDPRRTDRDPDPGE